MEGWALTVVTVFSSIMASTGFWAYLQRRDSLKGASAQLLLGLAHGRIVSLGQRYIERGSITSWEYEDYMKYLCRPYSKFGGNGLADKVINEVKQLPISSQHIAAVEEVSIKDKKIED